MTVSLLSNFCFRILTNLTQIEHQVQVQVYLTYTKYYVHKVKLILQQYLTKMEEEGKNKFDNMLL